MFYNDLGLFYLENGFDTGEKIVHNFYDVRFDYLAEILLKILKFYTPAQNILNAPTLSSIDLAITIPSVAAKLCKIEHNQNESYIPLIIKN
ncbi:hypothetical protein KDD93_06680 [Campylobacter sp. faydin G-24]|uniref:Uncharacterized protein n=1 Tax=Campylobacter anatolicus TaxID=2829105 RepID=A0ABS5HJ00_9BACT|nr:hypothetical protein [Campylobacter anatolicus]MBR8464245.1 hypothetical protein [Campylobacter anatolicus]